MINDRLERIGDYPFDRLRALLDLRSPRPNEAPLSLAVGEPQPVKAQHAAAGGPGLAAVRGWLDGGGVAADGLGRGRGCLGRGAGGLLLGLLLLALPELSGVGYPPLEKAIGGGFVVWFVLVLLAGKILATSLTIAIGGSGGVFAPSLFMGAMLGSAYGRGLHALLPTMTAHGGAYGLVGMGAVFAAAARAPITAVIIVFELTRDYRIILPLMFAVVLAAGVSNLLSRDTIYTLKLRRRGIELRRGRGANLMALLPVREAMQEVPASLHLETPLNEVIERLTEGPTDGLPVVDETGAYRGTVTSQQVEEAMRENALDADAGSLAREAAVLHPGQAVEQAPAALVRERDDALDRNHAAQGIRDMRDGHQPRTRAKQLRILIEQELARLPDRHHAQNGTDLGAEQLPRHDIGMMLHGADQDLVALFQPAAPVALRNEIDCLRSAAHEYDLFPGSGVDEASHALAGRLVGLGGTLAQDMHATVNIGVVALVVLGLRGDDRARLLRRRRVVEIHQRLAAHLGLEDRKLRPQTLDVVARRLRPGRQAVLRQRLSSPAPERREPVRPAPARPGPGCLRH